MWHLIERCIDHAEGLEAVVVASGTTRAECEQAAVIAFNVQLAEITSGELQFKTIDEVREWLDEQNVLTLLMQIP